MTRIVIAFSLVGIVAFDGVSIGVAHVSAADDANTVARSASQAWLDTHQADAALKAAESTAAQHQETVIPDSLKVATDGTVDVKIQRPATTLVVRHIHALHSWVTITATGSGKYTDS